jgi:hypothetical protein
VISKRSIKAHSIELTTRGEPGHFVASSQEEFIVQHHWGYTSQKDGGTIEYQVEHPPWRIWQGQSGRLTCDVEKLYGQRFVGTLSAQPSSVFLAEGSEIAVYKGRRIG